MDEFAKLAGVSKAYISMLEKNKNSTSGRPIKPSLDTLKNIATAMSLSLDNFLNMLDDNTTISLEKINKSQPALTHKRVSPMTKEMINKKIGNRIKTARKNANLTLLELANKIGLSEGNVQRYESGNITNVSVSVLEKFAAALDTTTAELMGWASHTTKSQPSLTRKDGRDIQKRLQSILDDLNSDAALSFYNGDQEMDDETKELLKVSLEQSIRTAKIRAKKKFTPNKYKK